MTRSNISLLHNTDRRLTSAFDCFHAYITDYVNRSDGSFLHTNHLTTYCRRPFSSDDSMNENIKLKQGYVENEMTFRSLRLKGIRSKDLFQWSIAIDIIEQYAIYLITDNTKFDELIFYNCSSLWFGSQCEYTFGLNTSIELFGDFAVSSFDTRTQFRNKVKINTCYPYLIGCYRGPEPMCLDWREICNGVIDCIGDNYGLDEKYCAELETNECKDDEYRCHNGAQCIPLEFFHDSWTSRDCLDGTDETGERVENSPVAGDYITLDCMKTLTISCEELSCRYDQSFPCGDGDCRRHGLTDNYIHPNGLFCPGTSRDRVYLRSIYTSLDHLSNECQKLLSSKLRFSMSITNDIYHKENYLFSDSFSLNNCSMDYVSFPAKPIFNDYFQVIYLPESLYNNLPPDYVCNDRRRCLHLPNTTLQIGGLDCRSFENLTGWSSIANLYSLHSSLASLARSCSLMNNIHDYTSNSSLFYCNTSQKYISKHRLIDGINDCYYREDEEYFDSCSLNDSQRFNCTSEEKCLSPLGIGNDLPDCIGNEDVFSNKPQSSVYPLLCDGIVDSTGADDESNCEWWPCHTPYTRCDGRYQCANAMDETDCPNSKCSADEFKCNVGNSVDYRCISQAHIYEKAINCDSLDIYDICYHRKLFYSRNSTINDKNEYLSWKEKTCITTDDICGYQSIYNHTLPCNAFPGSRVSSCNTSLLSIEKNNELLCGLKNRHIFQRLTRPISVLHLGYFPPIINQTLSSSEQQAQKNLTMKNSIELIEYCNRGIVIYQGKSYEKKCLCPPSYFGDQCQWQSQRISLTIQIRKQISVEKNNPIYEIFIFLIDDENGIINSYEKLTYMSLFDCQTKFNRYLLYPTRPKDLNRSYSLHIDIYNKRTLTYFGSWYISIPFLFLPVNRLARQLVIPSEECQFLTNCSLDCGNHGRCFHYINSTKEFCKCNANYSGRFCNLSSKCSCSFDSICLNSSICLCPLNKFGSKCYLEHPSCQSNNNPCQNNGQCIPINDLIGNKSYLCLCTEEYMGSNCQYEQNRIDITFKTKIIPQIIFVHYITAFNDRKHERITKFQKVPFDQNSVRLSVGQLFHIVLIEYFNQSYLAVLREQFVPSELISIDIHDENICRDVNELLNSTIINLTYHHRLKYYQLPCINNWKLKCFSDENHMCICDKNRFANCFDFNHSMSYDCHGFNPCLNHGKCFQDNATCPRKYVCMCEKCFYGSACQLTTQGFSLSLDVIFGYHIKPFASFLKQSIPVKITTTLTILMFLGGLINALLSILTFREKSLMKVGCGIYLLSSSIISLLTIIIFTIKYCQLILFQMNVITNHSLINISCILTDVMLKVLLSSGEWLNACVALERTVTVSQGIKFNKPKSCFIAKCVVPSVCLLIIVSYIHDPLARELFDDEDEQRTWCILKYSLELKKYDTFINLFHFLMPFVINLLSALITIIQVVRMRSKVEKTSAHKTFFCTQVNRHKHILISPCILIALALPRLITSLLSRCMESVGDPWLFLAGYYISFVPPLLTFAVFILPSETYRKKCLTAMKKIGLIPQRR